MDADIVEIPPPVHLLKKQKRAILPHVINVDDENDDSDDLVIIGEKVSKSNKGKTIEAIHQNPFQELSGYTFCQPHVENSGSAILPDVINVDDENDDSDDLVIIGEKVSKSNKGKTIEAIHQNPFQELSGYTFCQPHVENSGSDILHEVIDIDDNDESDDLVIFGEKVGKSNKRKTTEAIHQVVDVSHYVFCQPGVENFGQITGIESSNGFPLVSHNLINVDGRGYDDCIWEDYTNVDEYALLQARLDSPWYDTQSDAKNSHVTDSFQPSWSLEPNNSRIEGSTMGSSNLQIKMNNVDHSSGSELSFQLFSQATSSKKKSAASRCSGHGLNLSSGVESSKSKRFLKSFRSKIKSASFGSKNHGLGGNLEGKRLLHANKPPVATKFKSAKKADGSSSSYHANLKNEIPMKFRSYKQYNNVNDASDNHFIRENSMKEHPRTWAKNIKVYWKCLGWDLPCFASRLIPVISKGSFRSQTKFASFDSKNHTLKKLLHAEKPPAAAKLESAEKVGSCSSYNAKFKDEILRKFRSFKQFDSVSDASDHHFIQKNFPMQQHPKNWAKVIQKEWKILEKDLPASIFVRVYESRMDLLRVVIIGAEGTPYHDGLFFFDLYFPSAYPNVPPLVHSHSRRGSLNQNLCYNGQIWISLLNTYPGHGNECWLPGVSTILQVLVSIQGLILSTKPFFNGCASEFVRGLAVGERMSMLYDENVFIESLCTMIETIRRPPKNFEDFVVGHFISRAHDILVTYNACVELKPMKKVLHSRMDIFVSEIARIGAED